jgi:hypothetical protein
MFTMLSPQYPVSSRSQGYLRVSTRALLSDTYRSLRSLITQRSLVQIQPPQPTESKQITVVLRFPDFHQYFPSPQDNENFRHFYPPPMINLNLSARCWPPVLPEPWGSSFNDTKVPASGGLFASSYNRIPADPVPLYHGPRG